MAKVQEGRKPAEEWKKRIVAVDFKEKDYVEKSNELNNLSAELDIANMKKKAASDEVKDIKGKIEYVVDQIVKKKKEIEAESLWIFNWEEGLKRLMARIDGEIEMVFETDITDEDSQLEIPGGSDMDNDGVAE